MFATHAFLKKHRSQHTENTARVIIYYKLSTYAGLQMQVQIWERQRGPWLSTIPQGKLYRQDCLEDLSWRIGILKAHLFKPLGAEAQLILR